MSLFSALVGTAIEAAILPVAVLKDGLSLIYGEEPENTRDQLDEIKDAAKDR